MKGISDQDYEHAQQVWNTTEKETLGCYHDTYLKTDVLLLADVFETFRNTCLKNYKLDPANFYTTPALAWQVLLKTTAEYCEHEKGRKDCEICQDEFRLELLTDIDMLLMVEKDIQGGITQAVKRCAKTNNKSMKNLYNPDEQSIYLQYLVQKTFTDGQWFRTYQRMNLNGKREKTLPLKKHMNFLKKTTGEIS